MWAEIKKAINSTVGTKDFKALDEIIKANSVKPAEASAQSTSEQESEN